MPGPEDLFAGFPETLAVFRAVEAVVGEIDEAHDTTVATSRSQVAFKRRTGFAYVWRPGQYVRNDAPAVLSIALPRQVRSARWKDVVHPSPHTWMHHLELSSAAELDDEVRGWLQEAYDGSG